jgi:hypothetical protein
LGARPLNRIFQKVERAVATSQEKKYHHLTKQIEETINRDIAAIDALMATEPDNSHSSSTLTFADKADLVEAMGHLAALLDKGRLDAGRSFEQLKLLLSHERPNSEFMNLAEAIAGSIMSPQEKR